MLDICSSPRLRRSVLRSSLVDITNTLSSPRPPVLPSRPTLPSLPLKFLRRRICAISKLPPELLLHVCALGTLEHFSFPILFSHVCHLWRTLALSTPQLWTTIVLSKSYDDLLPPSYIHSILERGRAGPLDLRLDVGVYRKGAVADEAGAVWRAGIILDTVEPCATRWRSLELSLPSAFDLEDFLLRTLPRAQSLEKLVLHRADHNRLRSPNPQQPLQALYLPRLRYFQIDGFPLPGGVQRSTLIALRELHVLSIPVDFQPTATEWLDLLRGMTQLRLLALVGAIRRTASCDLAPTEVVPLPLLSKLDISHTPITPALYFLSHLQAPALQSLVAGSPPAGAYESLQPLCSLLTPWLYPRLRRLRLGYGRLTQSEMRVLEERDGLRVFGPVGLAGVGGLERAGGERERERRREGVEGANRRWREGLEGGWEGAT
ncbi:hypothetical protein DACRYDRAFT_24280 [Dacryopinax primogenitus]|uniref:Uncharacterized protein n=1 Tax=Dacryopinax primogenitus (strain DJM 731) TaxID=1858805 RepID=M5FTI6_DACPD|nr:uncharacterized protein DACRYDRAFT_24280 [Dacryopinax primogenitus]EJT98689.1 hypothetical protein DACRYDRAFT_24280 [Dacryopinax primogenitus]